MATLFKFEVVAPKRIFYSDEVEMITFNTENGEMGVMAGHVPMLIAHKPCVLTMSKNGEKKYAFISEGFIEVTKEKVTAIVDNAQWAEEIDVERAMRDKKWAEEQLINAKEDLQMKAQLQASIERAASRIKTARTLRQ
ncbi:MAG: ATP synthase F1 subunit epsilon [Clostridia bacterium]|nr:ATP synthase F1 subunit epsilon [Clostridia bacterium]